MNWLKFLCKFILNVRGDTISVNKVSLLKNDFWNTYNRNLYMVKVSLKDEEGHIYESELTKNTCYSLKYENSSFAVLKDSISKGLNSLDGLLRSDGVLLKTDFLTADIPIKDRRDFRVLRAKRKIHTTFKLLEKTSNDNVISMKNDGIDFCKCHIKEMINKWVNLKMIKLYKNINILQANQILGILDADRFNLYYFKNYSECIEILKNLRKI
jgi:hypothetical protein